MILGMVSKEGEVRPGSTRWIALSNSIQWGEWYLFTHLGAHACLQVMFLNHLTQETPCHPNSYRALNNNSGASPRYARDGVESTLDP